MALAVYLSCDKWLCNFEHYFNNRKCMSSISCDFLVTMAWLRHVRIMYAIVNASDAFRFKRQSAYSFVQIRSVSVNGYDVY